MNETIWNDAQDISGASTREFRIIRDGKRDVTGALWTPLDVTPRSTLVCFGHGASGDRYQAPICYLANRFVRERKLPVLSIDGPVHGLRQIGDGGRSAFFPEFEKDDVIVNMVDDWATAVSEVQALAKIGASNLAYFGLSMGSLFGIPFVASRDDVLCATLGLAGVQSNIPHGDALLRAAEQIKCPVLFLMQLEDEIFNRAGYLEVFDAFPSSDKRIHANPGLHPEIPAEEIDFAFDFLSDYIAGTATRHIINPLAE
jgi:predicted esterase